MYKESLVIYYLNCATYMYTHTYKNVCIFIHTHPYKYICIHTHTLLYREKGRGLPYIQSYT